MVWIKRLAKRRNNEEQVTRQENERRIKKAGRKGTDGMNEDGDRCEEGKIKET